MTDKIRLVCELDEEAKSVYINFEDAFGLDDDTYDELSLAKKRSYAKPACASRIKEAIQESFDGSELARVRFMSIRHHIESKPSYGDDDLARECALLVEDCRDTADEFIERVYVPAGERSRRRKANVELQFTDEHSKLVLKVSFLMKVLVPLITEYLACKGQGRNDELFLKCFEPCFEAVERPGVNIRDKLFKIVSSRIRTTRYSDKTMWNLLGNMSLDPNIISAQFFRKILVDILPKLEPTRPVISYLHVTLKNLLMYQFRANFDRTYRPQNMLEVVDPKQEKLTNFERLEFQLARLDESASLVTEAKLADLVVSCLRHPRIRITPGEVEYYKERLQVNTVQTQLMFLFFAKRVGRYHSLYNLKYGEYVILLAFFRKWLRANGFEFLSRWITTTFPEGIDQERRVINAKDFVDGLTMSRTYKYLGDVKYRYAMGNLVRHNVLAKLISTIFVNASVELESYETNLGEEGEPDRDLNSYPISRITDEVLKLVESI